jgi:tripartite-type tricarboxylate transporter receptor subunit TctC
MGVYVPAKTPAAVVNRLSDLLNKITDSDETKKFFAHIGADPFPGSPEKFTAFEASEFKAWAHRAAVAHIVAQ